MNGPELMSPADVAPLLGVTTSRVYQLVAAGSIPAIRRGRAIRIPRAAWEAWMTERCKEAVQGAKERRRAVSDDQG